LKDLHFLPNIVDIYPLSRLQQAILSLVQSTSNRAESLNRQSTFELIGFADVDSLKLAWHQVSVRYPTLRSAFVWQRLERPMQVVIQDSEPQFQCHDWRDLDESERNRRFQALADTERDRAFEVTQAPLCRLVACRIDDATHACILTYHALILDAWSIAPLVSELTDRYRALVRPQHTGSAADQNGATNDVVPSRLHRIHRVNRSSSCDRGHRADALSPTLSTDRCRTRQASARCCARGRRSHIHPRDRRGSRADVAIS
jgi:hypothetical protein